MVDHLANIARYGGKAASLLAQFHAGNHDMILPFTLVDPSEWERGGRPTFSFQNSQIVRGSAVGDEKGMVDVIPTFKNQRVHEIRGVNDNQGAIDNLIEASKHPSIVRYAQREGLTHYNGVSSVILQPQIAEGGYENRPCLRGSIVEHPNIKGHYLINLVTEQRNYTLIEQVLADATGNIVASDLKGRLSISEDTVKNIIYTKQRSRAVGFISSEFSSQMEFVFCNPSQDIETAQYDFSTTPSNQTVFTQERRFLPFDFGEDIDLARYGFNFFGKIPQQGIDLRVMKYGDIESEEFPSGILDDSVNTLYVMDDSIQRKHGLPLDFQPKNMVGFVVPVSVTVGGNSLEHNTYRHVINAQFSALTVKVSNRFSYEQYQSGETLHIKPNSIRRENLPSLSLDDFFKK